VEDLGGGGVVEEEEGFVVHHVLLCRGEGCGVLGGGGEGRGGGGGGGGWRGGRGGRGEGRGVPLREEAVGLFGFAPEEEGGHGWGGREGVDELAVEGGYGEVVGAGEWIQGIVISGRSSGGVIEWL